jgi:hypothetical protein
MMTAEERVRILSEAKPNSWLAFSSDESKVVACGATYAEAVENAERNGETDPVLVQIPDSWEPRVFISCV